MLDSEEYANMVVLVGGYFKSIKHITVGKLGDPKIILIYNLRGFEYEVVLYDHKREFDPDKFKPARATIYGALTKEGDAVRIKLFNYSTK